MYSRAARRNKRMTSAANAPDGYGKTSPEITKNCIRNELMVESNCVGEKQFVIKIN